MDDDLMNIVCYKAVWRFLLYLHPKGMKAMNEDYEYDFCMLLLCKSYNMQD